jgi:imidazolonepropionase-like amidohydrolase
LDVDSAPVTRWINLLKQKNIVVDPTLNVYEGKFGQRGGTSRLYYEVMLRMLKRLYDEGVTLVVGSDGPQSPGASLEREIEIWVSAGIPASKVLQAATIGAARVMKVDGQIGSISVGKKADLVLIDGDPTRNIADLRKCRIVIKRGTVYNSPDIQRTISTTSGRWFR